MTLESNIIGDGSTLIEALGKLNSLPGGSMTLFLVDKDNRLIGTLTDGDIRRTLLQGQPLDSPATAAAHKQFKAIRPDTKCPVAALKEYRESGITLVPRLDNSGRILEIIDLRKTRTRLPVKAILMAGGKGERLRPMTLSTPKPLLKIEGKAIIDYNIEALAAAGISDITVTTRYLAEQIEEHFASPLFGVKVKCVKEAMPLGTIGAATLAEIPQEGSTIVMNSDLLTSISFEELYLRHVQSEADITIAAIPYQVAVPFAILTIEGQQVVNLEEKPSYSYYANAGIYMFRNSVLRTLPHDTRTDATDLIAQTIENGGKVTYYPIKGTWIDIGSPTDFRQASELMRHHNNLSTND